MTGGRNGWSFATARAPASFAAAMHHRGGETEHAFDARVTLCGIPEEQLVLYRHRFRPDDARACMRCSELAAAAPTVACGQERLHDEVLTAAPGPLRTRLLDALLNGAAITMWVGGPADKIAFYVRLDRITDGADTVKTLLATRDRLGLARVAQPSGEFIILLPQHTSPIIAWAAPQNRRPAR